MKTAVVTGGSKGIGAAIVKLLCQEDWRVVFSYHHSQREAEEITHSFPASVAIYADLSIPEDATAFIKSAESQLKHIDLLVNNAGTAHYGLATQLSLAEWDYLFNLNVRAAFLCCQGALPQMINRKEGCIVNVASMWGEVGASCEVAYSASKAALIGFSKALAKELAPSNVRVNCVSPGVIATDMTTVLGKEALEALAEETPLGRLGLPKEVAQGVLYLAHADFVTGQVLGINGGIVI